MIDRPEKTASSARSRYVAGRIFGLILAVSALALCSFLPESESAPLRDRQERQIKLGFIDPNPAAFYRLTRHKHSLRLTFSYVSREWLEQEAAAGRTAVVTISPRGYSSAAIAKGMADAKLVEQARNANDF